MIYGTQQHGRCFYFAYHIHKNIAGFRHCRTVRLSFDASPVHKVLITASGLIESFFYFCVTVYLPANFYDESSSGLFLAYFFTGFRHFFNANNSKTVNATNPLKLRLLRRLRHGYECVTFELSIDPKGKSAFRTSDSTVIPGARVGRPDHDRSIVLDVGIVVIKFDDASSKGCMVVRNRNQFAVIYDVY
jgi:hypothetical protein